MELYNKFIKSAIFDYDISESTAIKIASKINWDVIETRKANEFIKSAMDNGVLEFKAIENASKINWNFITTHEASELIEMYVEKGFKKYKAIEITSKLEGYHTLFIKK